MDMIKHYTLENKPQFRHGDIVKVDFGTMFTNGKVISGRVVGKSQVNIIDHWLIEFHMIISPSYPYTTLAVQHTFIVDESSYMFKDENFMSASCKDQMDTIYKDIFGDTM